MYAQLVDLHRPRRVPGSARATPSSTAGRATLDEAHIEGSSRQEIMADPERFVVLDPDDGRWRCSTSSDAGKKLLLITNSEWTIRGSMMAYAFDRFLPGGMELARPLRRW